jgi:hypothetical protein
VVTEVKSNFRKIITEDLAEVKQLELGDWVMNEILQTVVVIANSLVFITDLGHSYCFTNFYIDYLLFRHPSYLFLLFLLYFLYCCILDFFSLSSYHLRIVTALGIVDFEYFAQTMIVPFIWENLFFFET